MNREAPPCHHRSDGPTLTAAAHLLVIGTNHRTSSLDTRERLLRKATYAALRKAGGRRPPWSDLALLTTCNRIEGTAVTDAPTQTAAAVRKTFGVSGA